jgi:hypothetical protein
MANLKTTLGKIKSFDPCAYGWKKLCKSLGTTDNKAEVTLLQILESNGVQDTYWALRCCDYRKYCLLLADGIKPVLHLSDCADVQNMSKTIRLWYYKKLTNRELAAARDATWATAKDAAKAAAKDAAWTAAFAAAKGTASDAVFAAVRAAANDAAWTTANDAAWTTASNAMRTAAWITAFAAAKDAAWERNEKLMRDFITQE